MATLREKLLKTADDVKKNMAVPFKVKKEKKELEVWIIGKEQKLAELESDLNDMKADDTLDVEAILYKQDDLALTKRQLEQGEALMKELFGKAE